MTTRRHFFWTHKFIEASNSRYAKYRWLSREGNAARIGDVINMRKTFAGSTKLRVSAGTRVFFVFSKSSDLSLKWGRESSAWNWECYNKSETDLILSSTRIRMNRAVPLPSLMPSQFAKGTLQIVCECVEMIVPCAVARPLWVLYWMSGFAIQRQFLAITRWVILPCNLPPSQ